MPDLATGPLDADTRAAVVRLAGRIEAEDGAPPLSDQTLTHLGSDDVQHVTARSAGTVAGYAQRGDEGAEIAAEPSAVDDLLDAVLAPGLLIWSHGRRSRLVAALEKRDLQRARELHQLRRPLDTVPEDPPLADRIEVRAFRPGADHAAWLAVNAAAFASHPEQGSWTEADLQARIDEPWFDAAGFLLAERDGELLGYHWTKVHPDGVGEVYVLGIAPAAQGLGLGKALLIRGLRHLSDRGCPDVLLYVDGDNPAAIGLYERAGFTSYDLDVQWRVS
ncbi:MAG: mycothiol synthase [Jatrophihabitans sp.]|uniref:mycothiol synthase n=1 Tax=Jatrophihabitans sp. TaxID=1932789 RepID=UPI003914C03A